MLFGEQVLVQSSQQKIIVPSVAEKLDKAVVVKLVDTLS
jgi:hypothetical protein